MTARESLRLLEQLGTVSALYRDAEPGSADRSRAESQLRDLHVAHGLRSSDGGSGWSRDGDTHGDRRPPRFESRWE